MFNSNRFSVPIALAALVAIPIFANGCSAASAITNATGSVCCTQFQVGTDMSGADFGVDASIAGQFDALAQASGDLAATADSMASDVLAACQGIALDLNADTSTADGTTGTAAVTAWCNVASKAITTALAGASITVAFDPPQCTASVSAQANCDAHCSVNGSCNAQANPPTCTGGTLEVSCTGSCTGSATAPSIDCTGTCSGNCSGSCSASGGVAVNCTGKCDGTCAAGGSSSGSGVQADGSCKGTCQGTCTASATAPAVSCSGSCQGKCDATCSATPGSASFSCGGSCSAGATPISCKGGTLKASCQVDANCDANCSASASAKADCTPPQVSVTTTVTALTATLEANLPKILVAVLARGKAFEDEVTAISTSAPNVISSFGSNISVTSVACGAQMVGAIAGAVANVQVAIPAAASVTTAVNISTP